MVNRFPFSARMQFQDHATNGRPKTLCILLKRSVWRANRGPAMLQAVIPRLHKDRELLGRECVMQTELGGPARPTRVQTLETQEAALRGIDRPPGGDFAQ